MDTATNNFAPLVSYMATERGFSRSTIEGTVRNLTEFAAYLQGNGATLDAMTTDLIQSYIRSLGEKPLASSTVCLKLTSIRLYLRFRQAQGDNVAGLLAGIDGPKKVKPLPKILGRAQTESLVEAELPGCHQLRNAAMLALLYATGIRVSELCDANLDDLNLKAGTLRVHGKGSKERIVLFDGKTSETIAAYLRACRPVTSGHIFVSKSGLRMNRHDVGVIVGKARNAAGVAAAATPHTLRHCFASHMLSGGADLRTIQTLLGHENVQTTAVYLHLDLAHLKKIHAMHPRS